MPRLYQQRAAFEKDLLRELRPLTKGAAWKLSSCALFRQDGDWHQDIFASVHRDSATTRATLRFKSMGIDPILWDILGIPENRKEPLSFRTWGAFTCSGVPVFETNVEQAGDSPRQVADALMVLADSAHAAIAPRIEAEKFSDIVARHPNQQARGAYSITLVASLVHEGALQQALDVAAACLSGAMPSAVNMRSEGQSFFERAEPFIRRLMN